jgi:hypothetical protein
VPARGEELVVALRAEPDDEIATVAEDGQEMRNRAGDMPVKLRQMRERAIAACKGECGAALEGGDLRAFPFEARALKRIYQMDATRHVRRYCWNNNERAEVIAGVKW